MGSNCRKQRVRFFARARFSIRNVLENHTRPGELIMKSQTFLVLASLLISSSTVFAAGTVTGTATINGKTVTFTQGRAWKTGGKSPMGAVEIKLLIAEKSLDGLDAMALQADVTTGKRGRVFEIQPDSAPNLPVNKYKIDEDYHLSLWANDFGLGEGETWQGIPLQKASLVVDDISVADNTVQGTLEWKGEQTQNHMSDTKEDKLTGVKLTFKLPLEDGYPGSKK